MATMPSGSWAGAGCGLVSAAGRDAFVGSFFKDGHSCCACPLGGFHCSTCLTGCLSGGASSIVAVPKS
eukprot:7497321-Karenia_brevis.AAC.1